MREKLKSEREKQKSGLTWVEKEEKVDVICYQKLKKQQCVDQKETEGVKYKFIIFYHYILN